MRPLLCLEQGRTQISNSDRKLILEQALERTNIPEEILKSASSHAYELPFYQDVILYELTANSWRPSDSRLCFLKHGNETWHLQGTSSPIHDVNRQADIWITHDTVLEYLAFFCFFVRGEEGPFFIIDRLDNPFLPDDLPIDEIADKFREPRIWGQDENGDWRVSALVYYSNAIFFADFIVEPLGMISMQEDTPLIADLDSAVVAPLEVVGGMNG